MDDQSLQKPEQNALLGRKGENKKYVVSSKVAELHRQTFKNDPIFIQGNKNKQSKINITKELNGGILLSLDDVTLLVSVTCPYCQAEIRHSDDVIQCKNCKVYHHLECWTSYDGCTTLGCVYNHYLK